MSPGGVPIGKACEQCGGEMPREAVLCRHCSSYQGWRRFAQIVVMLLPLVPISLFAATVHQYVDEVLSGDVLFHLLSCSPEKIVIAVSNKGDAPSLLLKPILLEKYREGFAASKFVLDDPSSNAVLPAKQGSVITYDIKIDDWTAELPPNHYAVEAGARVAFRDVKRSERLECKIGR